MTTREELQHVKDAAETTLRNLMDLLHRSPELATEIRALVSGSDQVQDYTVLAMQNPELAQQILRISLATLANSFIADEIRRKLDETN